MNSTRRPVEIGRRNSGRQFLATVGCLLAAACRLAGEQPVFVVESTRADTPTGPLIRLTPDGAVQVGGDPTVAAQEVVAIRRQGQSPPNHPNNGPCVTFVNGDRLPGRLLSIGEERARILADVGAPQELTVPLSSLAGIWLTDAPSEPPSEKRRDDVVMLSNGDTTSGTLAAWPAEGPLRFDVNGRTLDIPRDRIRAVVLSPQLARAASPRSAYRQVVLTNGARLSTRSLELKGDELRATTVSGGGVRIPLASLAAVNVYHGPAVYLSDLSPRRYEQTPYLGIRWPWIADRAVSGGSLRLGGGTYDKGLGMHSRSRLSFPIPDAAVRFESWVGLDEVAGRLGNVEVQVLADGKPLLDRQCELAGSRPAKWLRLPLSAGAGELTLVVDYGQGGDVQDHVDWGDARIIVGNAGRK
jgi:hypothetical protein